MLVRIMCDILQGFFFFFGGGMLIRLLTYPRCGKIYKSDRKRADLASKGYVGTDWPLRILY